MDMQHSTQSVDPDRRITFFATTHTRGKREMFGIRSIDRGKHMYVIGKTGMGKSTMLENMAIQDIQHGEGMAFIDPHGSSAEKLLDFVPHERINDVVYFAPFDTDFPMGFNVMEDVGYDKRHFVVSGLMGAFKRIWVDAWSARMEYILQNTLLALLEYPGATLIDVNRMLINKAYRAEVLTHVTDPIVMAFWKEEFANFTDTYTREALPAIQNKIGQFISNPLVRNIIGQPKSSFDMRALMDEKKIFIVNLSKGRMGETNASLLGSMLTVKIYLAAMSRADESPSRMAKLSRFFFYVDEFQSMMNEAFADILSEARKYKLALTLANQYIEQMEEKVRDAVFGNVGTTVCFRVGPFDAEVLKTVFEPTFFAEDLVNLGLGEVYLTLMIDGVGSQPFSAQTIPPIEAPVVSYKNDVIEHSRARYAVPRKQIEDLIVRKQAEFVAPPPEKKQSKFPRQEYKESKSPLDALRATHPSAMHAQVQKPSPAPQASTIRPASQLSSKQNARTPHDTHQQPIPPRVSSDHTAKSDLKAALAQIPNSNPKPPIEYTPESRGVSPAEIMRTKHGRAHTAHTAPPEASVPAHVPTSVTKTEDAGLSPDFLRRIINGDAA